MLIWKLPLAGILLGGLVPAVAQTVGEETDTEAAEQAVLVTKIYNTEGLYQATSPFDDDESYKLLPIQNAGWRGRTNHVESRLEPFIGLFTDVYWQEMEYEGRMIQTDSNGNTLLRCPEEVHAGFSALLEYYEGILNAHTELQVDVVRGGGALPPQWGLQLPETVDSWLGALPKEAKRVTYTLQVPNHTAAVFQDVTVTPVIGKIEVEIAHGISTSRGERTSIRSGLSGAIAAAPRTGGVQLSLAWMASNTPSVTNKGLGSVAMWGGEGNATSAHILGGTVQLTEQTALAQTSSAFLPDGQVLVHNLQSETEGASAVVVIRNLAAPKPASQFVQEGAMALRIDTSWHRSLEPTHLAWDIFGHEWRPMNYNFGDGYGYVRNYGDYGDLTEALLEGGGSESIMFQNQDGMLMRMTTSQSNTEHAKQISILDQGSERLRLLDVPPKNYKVSVKLLDAKNNTHASAHCITIPGSPLQILGGKEVTEIMHFEAEVAQHSAIQAPEVVLNFEGLVLDLELLKLSGDSLKVQVEGLVHWPSQTFDVNPSPKSHDSFTMTQYSEVNFNGFKILRPDGNGVYRTGWGGQGSARIEVEIQSL